MRERASKPVTVYSLSVFLSRIVKTDEGEMARGATSISVMNNFFPLPAL